jgi:hypothetical protein
MYYYIKKKWSVSKPYNTSTLHQDLSIFTQVAIKTEQIMVKLLKLLPVSVYPRHQREIQCSLAHAFGCSMSFWHPSHKDFFILTLFIKKIRNKLDRNLFLISDPLTLCQGGWRNSWRSHVCGLAPFPFSFFLLSFFLPSFISTHLVVTLLVILSSLSQIWILGARNWLHELVSSSCWACMSSLPSYFVVFWNFYLDELMC